jgi:pimeloyl-[acyl-carrier protein] methyl ester esterase
MTTLVKVNLILLPGWGMESSIWSSLEQPLSSRFQLFYVDWRGVREATDYVDRVRQLIEEKHLKSFAIMGWSLGSLVALEIASRFPTQLTHLILFGGTSRFTIDEGTEYTIGWKKRIVERMQRGLEKDHQGTLTAFYELMFSQKEIEKGDLDHFIAFTNQHFEGDDLHSLMLGLTFLMITDLRERLKSIKCPTLLIHGEQDKVCPLEASKYIYHKLNTHKALHILPDSGHLPFMTDSQVCLDWVIEFMEVAR